MHHSFRPPLSDLATNRRDSCFGGFVLNPLSEIHKIGRFFPSENVHQLTPAGGVLETAKCSFIGKLLCIFIPRLLISLDITATAFFFLIEIFFRDFNYPKEDFFHESRGEHLLA